MSVQHLYTIPNWRCCDCGVGTDSDVDPAFSARPFLSEKAEVRCAKCWRKVDDRAALEKLIGRLKRNPDLVSALREVLGVVS